MSNHLTFQTSSSITWPAWIKAPGLQDPVCFTWICSLLPCLTPSPQVSPTIIIPGFTKCKTSTTVVPPVMISNNGIIPGKSRTVNSLTSPSASFYKDLIQTYKLTQTAAAWLRKQIMSEASSSIMPTTSCFWELTASASTLQSVSRTAVPTKPRLTDATLLDIPADDLRVILSRLSRAPSYVTQEVRILWYHTIPNN